MRKEKKKEKREKGLCLVQIWSELEIFIPIQGCTSSHKRTLHYGKILCLSGQYGNHITSLVTLPIASHNSLKDATLPIA
jgi:hypothetical protein